MTVLTVPNDPRGASPTTAQGVGAAAWQAAGRPRIMAATVAGVRECARCDRPDRLVSTGKVVSSSFCGFSTWSSPNGPGLCACCTWLFRDAGARTQIQHVLTDPSRLRPLTRTQLRHVLSRPIGALESLVVPQSGRKHLLPEATWGLVTLDDAQIPWSQADADLLQIVATLRRRGAGEQALHGTTPPWALLRGLPARDRGEVMRLWSNLDSWRQGRMLWLELAIIATRANR